MNEILQDTLTKLQAKKQEIEAAMEAVEALLLNSSADEPLTADPAVPQSRKRRSRSKPTAAVGPIPTPISITDEVEAVLTAAGGPMKIQEIEKVLRREGRVALSKNHPYQQIQGTLIRGEGKRFKKAGRGLWTVRKGR